VAEKGDSIPLLRPQFFEGMGKATAVLIQFSEGDSFALKDDGGPVRVLGGGSFGDVADGRPAEEVHFPRENRGHFQTLHGESLLRWDGKIWGLYFPLPVLRSSNLKNILPSFSK
jgi:hypothetical protein